MFLSHLTKASLSHRYFLFHVDGINKRSIGNNSSLPASISKQSTILESGVYAPKFCVGPTPARPGPILLSVAAIAVKFVSKSKLSKLIIIKDKKKIIAYVHKNTLADRSTVCSIFFPSIFNILILLGCSKDANSFLIVFT